jgi:hypothetical protein
MFGVAIAASLAGGFVATARGVPFWVGPSSLAATLPGLAASLGVLALRPAQPAHAWAMPVLAGTMLRAMLTLMIALVVVTATAIDKPVFMLTVLGVLLACLAIEVGVVLRMINPRGAATQPASLEGARS